MLPATTRWNYHKPNFHEPECITKVHLCFLSSTDPHWMQSISHWIGQQGRMARMHLHLNAALYKCISLKNRIKILIAHYRYYHFVFSSRPFISLISLNSWKFHIITIILKINSIKTYVWNKLTASSMMNIDA